MKIEKLFVEAQVKALKEGEFEVIASTPHQDRMGDVIKPDGWVLTNYKKNPVMLWGHNSMLPPVAKATKVWVEDNRLMLRGVFAETELAQELKSLVAGGFLNAVSVGFLPMMKDDKGNIDIEGKMYRRATEEEIKDISKGIYREGNIFDKQELLEVSWVSVPALPQALVSARGMGIEFPLLSKAMETKDIEIQEEKKAETQDESVKSLEERISVLEKEVELLRVANPSQEAKTPEKEGSVISKNKGRKDGSMKERTIKTNPELRALRIIDKAVEILIVTKKRDEKEK